MVVTVDMFGDEVTFLLGSREIAEGSDLEVYSEKSPLGAAIIGKKVGDVRDLRGPQRQGAAGQGPQGHAVRALTGHTADAAHVRPAASPPMRGRRPSSLSAGRQSPAAPARGPPGASAPAAGPDRHRSAAGRAAVLPVGQRHEDQQTAAAQIRV